MNLQTFHILPNSVIHIYSVINPLIIVFEYDQ